MNKIARIKDEVIDSVVDADVVDPAWPSQFTELYVLRTDAQVAPGQKISRNSFAVQAATATLVGECVVRDLTRVPPDVMITEAP